MHTILPSLFTPSHIESKKATHTAKNDSEFYQGNFLHYTEDDYNHPESSNGSLDNYKELETTLTTVEWLALNEKKDTFEAINLSMIMDEVPYHSIWQSLLTSLPGELVPMLGSSTGRLSYLNRYASAINTVLPNNSISSNVTSSDNLHSVHKSDRISHHTTVDTAIWLNAKADRMPASSKQVKARRSVADIAFHWSLASLQKWQEKHVAIIESQDHVAIYIRDYSLSEQQVSNLFQLKNEYIQTLKSTKVIINGKQQKNDTK